MPGHLTKDDKKASAHQCDGPCKNVHGRGKLNVCTCDRVTQPGSAYDALALLHCSNAPRTLSDQDTVMCGDHDDESWSHPSLLVVMKSETKHPECKV